MIRTKGLRHIQFVVRDGERSLAFWQRLLGVQEQFREGNLIFVGVPGGGDLITLHESPDGPIGIPGGVVHFGFALEPGVDIGAALADIKAAGGTVLRTGAHGEGQPFIYFSDLDGYEIELFTP